MTAPRIGLLVIDGVTLQEITPVRDRLEAAGAQVTVVVPTGGPILPVGGRYFPAAGGHGCARCALSQLSPGDCDLLLLPDSVLGEQLAAQPQVLSLLRGEAMGSSLLPVPVFTQEQLLQLLDRGCSLRGLAGQPEVALSGGGARKG